MADPPGRTLTIPMAVKVVACVGAIVRVTEGVKWDEFDIERVRVGSRQLARINVAVGEISRVLRILEGEDPPVP